MNAEKLRAMGVVVEKKSATSTRPSWEPIIVAMKPIDGGFIQNAIKHGVSGLHIDASRIEYRSESDKASATPQGKCTSKEISAIGAEPDAGRNLDRVEFDRPAQTGRWPSNLLLSHSHECGELCKEDCPVRLLNEQSGSVSYGKKTGGYSYAGKEYNVKGFIGSCKPQSPSNYGDSGGASRFFYVSKVSKKERNAGLPEGSQNTHPTVKPIKLMEYLCTLTETPTKGVVLDPFMGSGSTGIGCIRTGRKFVGIELEEESFRISKLRIEHAYNEKRKTKARDLFGDRHG